MGFYRTLRHAQGRRYLGTAKALCPEGGHFTLARRQGVYSGLHPSLQIRGLRRLLGPASRVIRQ
jgi:hypothetical protein